MRTQVAITIVITGEVDNDPGNTIGEKTFLELCNEGIYIIKGSDEVDSSYDAEGKAMIVGHPGCFRLSIRFSGNRCRKWSGHVSISEGG